MDFQPFVKMLGTLWGHLVIRPYIAFLQRRCATFDLTVSGGEHLASVAEGPFVLVSNHLLMRRTELWPTFYVRCLLPYHRPPDSFVYRRIVKDRFDKEIQGVSNSGFFDSPKYGWQKWLELYFSNPFLRAGMSTCNNMILTEKPSVSGQRRLLKDIEGAVSRQEPVMIFPQTKEHWEALNGADDLGSLAATVAYKYNLSILPSCLGNSNTWKKGNKATVAFGPPFRTDGMSKSDINKEIYARINCLVDKSTKREFAFLVGGTEPWSESDELWFGMATHISKGGHQVSVVKYAVDGNHERIKELIRCNIDLNDYNADSTPAAVNYLRSLVPYRYRPAAWIDGRYRRLKARLLSINPQLAIVCLSRNVDGLMLAGACLDHGYPYILIVHRAFDQLWPPDPIHADMKFIYQSAKSVFFTSEHDKQLTELQIGVKLSRAEIVQDFYRFPEHGPLRWPQGESGRVRLACLGTFSVNEDRQDMLLKLLAQKKWQERPIDITFYGHVNEGKSLRSAADFLQLNNVTFSDYDEDAIPWHTHHAVVVPSISQNKSQHVVEALACGRPAIMTSPHCDSEFVEHGVTGFCMEGQGETDLDRVLEHAWQLKDRWEYIGCEAAKRIRVRLSPHAAKDLAERLAGA
jgi:glycosyltransferase involved in cell wall biosynthesis